MSSDVAGEIVPCNLFMSPSLSKPNPLEECSNGNLSQNDDQSSSFISDQIKNDLDLPTHSHSPIDPQPSSSGNSIVDGGQMDETMDNSLEKLNGKCTSPTATISPSHNSNLAINRRRLNDEFAKALANSEMRKGNLGIKHAMRPLTISVASPNDHIACKTTAPYHLSSRDHIPSELNTTIIGNDHRPVANTAPLSPNHYTSILTTATPANAMRYIRTPYAFANPPSQNVFIRRKVHSSNFMVRSDRYTPNDSSPNNPVKKNGDDQLHVANEQDLNKALDLLKSSQQQIKRSAIKKPLNINVRDNTFGQNRKLLQERIGRLRETNGLVLSVPHLDRAHLNQLVNLLQRFKDYFSATNALPKNVIENIFGCESLEDAIELDKRNIEKSSLCKGSSAVDPEMTESSSESESDDEEQRPSTSGGANNTYNREYFRHYSERVLLGNADARALFIEEQCVEQIKSLEEKLVNLRKDKESVFSNEDLDTEISSESCARCRPFNGRRRRKLENRFDNAVNNDDLDFSLDPNERLRSYASIDDRIFLPTALLSDVPLERRIETYCRRKSSRPAVFIRRRHDKTTWTTYLEERKVAVKEAVIVDERQKRKRTKISDNEKNHCGSRPTAKRSRRNSNRTNRSSSPLKRAGQKLVRRSLDRKRHSDLRSRILDSRHRILRSTDVDDADGIRGLLQKMDYKEICIPMWKKNPLNLINHEQGGCSHLAENASAAEIARRHLPYELNERKRFQQFRESSTGRSTTAATVTSDSLWKQRGATASNATGSVCSASLLGTASSMPSPMTPCFESGGYRSRSSSAEWMEQASSLSPYSPRVFTNSSTAQGK